MLVVTDASAVVADELAVVSAETDAFAAIYNGPKTAALLTNGVEPGAAGVLISPSRSACMLVAAAFIAASTTSKVSAFANGSREPGMPGKAPGRACGPRATLDATRETISACMLK